MLTRWRCLAALVLFTVVIGASPVAALADPSECDRTTDPWCTVEGGGPDGGGGGGDGGGGGGGCKWKGQTVPCTDPDFGSYAGNGCYWKPILPKPDHSPPAGQDPTKGAWGVMSCYTAPGGGVVTQTNYWMPDGAAPGPTPEELAQQALAKIHLLGAHINIAPKPNGSGAVGLPVWLSTEVTPGTWGPLSASASGGGITVNLTAKASHIVWNMGDRQSVPCANPGTPYSASYGNSASPTCGYRYSTPSSTAANPHGRYTVTATTFWTVEWAGGGQTGVLNPTSQAQTTVEIGEIQVVGQ